MLKRLGKLFRIDSRILEVITELYPLTAGEGAKWIETAARLTIAPELIAVPRYLAGETLNIIELNDQAKKGGERVQPDVAVPVTLHREASTGINVSARAADRSTAETTESMAPSRSQVVEQEGSATDSGPPAVTPSLTTTRASTSVINIPAPIMLAEEDIAIVTDTGEGEVIDEDTKPSPPPSLKEEESPSPELPLPLPPLPPKIPPTSSLPLPPSETISRRSSTIYRIVPEEDLKAFKERIRLAQTLSDIAMRPHPPDVASVDVVMDQVGFRPLKLFDCEICQRFMISLWT